MVSVITSIYTIYSRELPQPSAIALAQNGAPSVSNISSENSSSNNVTARSSLINPNIIRNSTNVAISNSVFNTTSSNSYLENKLSSGLPSSSTVIPVVASNNSKYLSSTELIDIPTSYLDQSEVLKHLIPKDTSGKEKNTLLSGSLGGFSDQSASSSNSALNAGGLLDSASLSSSTTTHSSHQHVPNYIGGSEDSTGDISALLQRLPPSTFLPWQLDTPSPLRNYEKKLSSDASSTKSMDKNVLSKSQPDLTRVGNFKEIPFNEDINR